MKSTKWIKDQFIKNLKPRKFAIEFVQRTKSFNNVTIMNGLRYLEELGLDYCNPLSLGLGQTNAEPYITKLMTELLELNGKEKILEVGTGSGYQAVILAELAADIYTIEIFPKLAEQARSIFKSLGYKNIYCKLGDGYEGWSEYAPYDAIIVTVSCNNIPPQVLFQLKENGILLIPLVLNDRYQYLWKIIKLKEILQVESIGRVCFPSLKRTNAINAIL